MREAILSYLRSGASETAADIAQCLGMGAREVQDALRDMDDLGDVLMRNGRYRISEAAKKRGAGENHKNPAP